jgi:hypothetical protein
MKSYAIEFNGSGEVCDGDFANEREAKSWAAGVLERRGHQYNTLVFGQWEQAGFDGDSQRWRMLIWDGQNAENDNGQNAICQLCKVVE